MTTATIQTARPPAGALEWAASNVNIQDGCEHDCRYCYAKTMAIRFKRTTAASWGEPRLRNILPLNCPRDPEAVRRGEDLVALQSDKAIRALYARYRRDPKIKWKDSIKAVVGLKRPASSGLDQ